MNLKVTDERALVTKTKLKVATVLTFRERSISSYFLAWGKSKRFAKAESERKCEPPTFGATCSAYNHSTMARVDLRVSPLHQHVISSGEADTCPFEKRVHVRERERNETTARCAEWE